MGQIVSVSAESTTPVGERLGSERLYQEPNGAVEIPVDGGVSVAPKSRKEPKPPPAAKQPTAPVQEKPVAAKRADVNWRGFISNLLEIVGIIAITAGCALIHLWLSFIVGGILLVILGVATGLEVTS